LGLFWILIQKFQIGAPGSGFGTGSAKENIMAWVRNYLKDYPEAQKKLSTESFPGCFKDGILFSYLDHRTAPELIDLDDVHKDGDLNHRIELALDLAEEMGIPKLIDAEDMMQEKPDEQSLLTYLSTFKAKIEAGDYVIPQREKKQKEPVVVVEEAPVPPPRDTKYEDLENELKRIKAEYENLQKNLHSAQEVNNTAKHKIDELEEVIKTNPSTEEIMKIKQELEDWKVRAIRAENRQRELEEENERLKLENEKLKAEMENLKSDLKATKEQNEKLRQKAEELERLMTTTPTTEELARLRKELEEWKERALRAEQLVK